MRALTLSLIFVFISLLAACTPAKKADVLIINAQVYDGSGAEAQALDIAICAQLLCGVSTRGDSPFVADKVINAEGLVLSPGFIDPHTHSFAELSSEDKHTNLNYLFQGVTTVVNGNDGDGPADIEAALARLNPHGIGTNLALFAGHGTIRKAVMGTAERQATAAELAQMKALVKDAMEAGALGLSTGLYYVPGQFANTHEVVELAKVAAEYGGIYETHIRDESSFNIGFLAAIDEAIDIAEQANIPLHLAHIKALGVDVWGQSREAITKVEQAQQRGVKISADQYPWLASGTNIRSAIVPKWAMADSEAAFLERLDNETTLARIKLEIIDNIRRRGGADKLLITASAQTSWVGQNLQQLADLWQLTPVDATLKMVRMGRHRVASYNMNPQDVAAFMRQPWVVTSSDGTNGHPRKYASFPKKYREYVLEKQYLSLARFVYASSWQTAQILGLSNRGKIAQGMVADVLLFDPNTFRHQASFSHWNRLSQGVKYLWVNGVETINPQGYSGALAGQFLPLQRSIVRPL